MLSTAPTGGLGTIEACKIMKRICNKLNSCGYIRCCSGFDVVNQTGQILESELAYDAFVWRPFEVFMKGPFPSLLTMTGHLVSNN
jgi:hypothetical protein